MLKKATSSSERPWLCVLGSARVWFSFQRFPDFFVESFEEGDLHKLIFSQFLFEDFPELSHLLFVLSDLVKVAKIRDDHSRPGKH